MYKIQNSQNKHFSLIQCFYGLSKDRIIATTKAMQHMLRSNPFPSEWIFVEAQHSYDHIQFKWLENYGAKHIFIKTTTKHDDIPLKSALWNIGAKEAKYQNLAFVDADCWFKNTNWTTDAASAIEEYDFCSLSDVCIYNEKPDNRLQSIGNRWLKCKDTATSSGNCQVKFGHCGFTLGAKKRTFEAVGKMPTLPVLEDIYLWSKIFGSRYFYNNTSNLLWNTKDIQKQRQKFNVGSAVGECVHVFHGDYMLRKYADILNVAKLVQFEPFQGIKYDKNGLPWWDNSKTGKFMRKFMHMIARPNTSAQLAVDIALEEIQ